MQKLEGTVQKSVDDEEVKLSNENHTEIKQQISKPASDEDSRHQGSNWNPACEAVFKHNSQSRGV